jgi:hypothetical protein
MGQQARAVKIYLRSVAGRTHQQGCDSSNHVVVRPPRLRHPHRTARPATRWSPRPSSASLPAGRGSGTPGPLRSMTSTRMTPSSVLTATVTVSPGAPEALCRRLLEKSSPPRAARPRPRTGDRSLAPLPRTRGPAAPAPPAPPAPQASRSSRTARPAISTPAFPAALVPGNHAGRQADTTGCTLDSAANVKPRGAPGTGTGTPPSGYPHRSLAPIPVRHASVDTATQGSTTEQGDT